MIEQNQVLVAAAIVFLGLTTPETKNTIHPANHCQCLKHTNEAACKKNGYHCTPKDSKDNVTSKLSDYSSLL